tara:strand:- start:366 stop:860 length:495 start_codon:yes stop_codon:yes gene_type:complete
MRKLFLTLPFILFFIYSCSYKPIYQKSPLLSHKIYIVVKSKDRNENNLNLVKLHVSEQINIKNSKPSNLKLIIALKRNISGLGVNKDIYSFGRMLSYNLNYSLYDKKGLLTSGKLEGKSSYNVSGNTYGNLVSVEDASRKILTSLSSSLGKIILSSSFKRQVIP